MNCTKCGKEIPDGENKICEDCQKELISEIEQTEQQEVIQEEVKNEKKTKTVNKKIEELSNKFKIKKENFTKKNVISGIIFCAIVAIVIFLVVLLINFVGESKVGNTIGNIRNYGYAAEKSGWIYYLAPNEDGSNIGVFKIKANKKNAEPQMLQMKEWDVLSINVVKNYVYFIGILPEEFNENDQINNKIYRMKTDGSNLEVINDNEFNNDCYEIYVINNKIYYIGTDSNIYKMNLDGSKKELVLDNGTGYLGITDKYIIYNVENEERTDYNTHIMDLDGKNSRPIIENTRLYSVNIDNNYVYYTNENKQICRVKINGSEPETLYDVTAYNMNAYGKYIYYLNYVDIENEDYTICIYRVKKDGSSETPEKIKEFDTASTFIDVVGNWIIYMDANENEGFINLVKVDGKEEKRLYTLNYEEYFTGDSTEESGTTEEVPEETPTEEQPAEETDTTVTNEVEESVNTAVTNEVEENVNTVENTNVVENTSEETSKTVENITDTNTSAETNTVEQ